MEPQIRYATTSDGVSIAYAQTGEGPDLVCVPIAWQTHAQLMWKQKWAPQPLLAAEFRVTAYDSRGCGLSQRDARDFSLDAMLLDLEAAVGAAGLERFVLHAYYDGVPVAVRYAAGHPDRLTHLILSDGWAQISDYTQTGVFEMEGALREMDWVLFTDTLGRVLAGFDNAEDGTAFAEYIRACVSQEGYKAAAAAMTLWDVSSDLSRITAPTLVTHSPGSKWLPVESGQRLAAGIPGAVFRLHDVFEVEEMAPIFAEFCGVSPRARAGLPAAALQTILFTDVEGSTALTDRLGDAAAREVMREHERITREALKAHGGSEVKTMGDGFMASFGSATKALECAVAIQRAFADPNRGVGVEQLPNDVSNSDEGVAVAQPLRAPASSKPSAEDAIRVRIGLNAGEPIAEDDPDGRGDLFGTAVIVAARIAAQAHGGEILVSDVVRQLVAGKGFLFNDRGEQALKGFEDPVRVWEVQWSE